MATPSAPLVVTEARLRDGAVVDLHCAGGLVTAVVPTGTLPVPVGAELVEAAGGRRTPLDRVLAPANRTASRLFLRESRRKVWANAVALHEARLRGPADHAVCLADLEAASAARVRDLLRPGPVLLRLAVHGFGVTVG